MTTTIIRGSEVNRPVPEAIKSSVLDHATVAENASFGLRNNEGLWPSYNCLDTLIPTPYCEDDEPTPKTFATAGWVPAFEFAVHGGVQCSAVGLDQNDQKSEVERVFRLSEGKGIEKALLATRFIADASTPSLWDAPVDITPATAVDLKTALALLEGYAATVYAGVPTIHMPRAAGSYLGDRIVWEGDKAYTRMGSKVAFGGGYDPETFTGTWDMYATGEVYVERSDEVSVQTFVIPGDGSNNGTADDGIHDNTSLALVERMYRVAIDCFVAKVTGSLTAGGGGVGPAGPSAYDVAVSNGFEGTEQDWLDSLVGPAGADGADGADGAQGPPGADGADGADGVVQTIVAGDGVTVDDTDPANPIVSVP